MEAQEKARRAREKADAASAEAKKLGRTPGFGARWDEVGRLERRAVRLETEVRRLK